MLIQTITNYGIISARNLDGKEHESEQGSSIFPKFAVQFERPCSISKQLEVSINFADEEGMILEIQTDDKDKRQITFRCQMVE